MDSLITESTAVLFQPLEINDKTILPPQKSPSATLTIDYIFFYFEFIHIDTYIHTYTLYIHIYNVYKCVVFASYFSGLFATFKSLTFVTVTFKLFITRPVFNHVCY